MRKKRTRPRPGGPLASALPLLALPRRQAVPRAFRAPYWLKSCCISFATSPACIARTAPHPRHSPPATRRPPLWHGTTWPPGSKRRAKVCCPACPIPPPNPLAQQPLMFVTNGGFDYTTNVHLRPGPGGGGAWLVVRQGCIWPFWTVLVIFGIFCHV